MADNFLDPIDSDNFSQSQRGRRTPRLGSIVNPASPQVYGRGNRAPVGRTVSEDVQAEVDALDDSQSSSDIVAPVAPAPVAQRQSYEGSDAPMGMAKVAMQKLASGQPLSPRDARALRERRSVEAEAQRTGQAVDQPAFIRPSGDVASMPVGSRYRTQEDAQIQRAQVDQQNAEAKAGESRAIEKWRAAGMKYFRTPDGRLQLDRDESGNVRFHASEFAVEKTPDGETVLARRGENGKREVKRVPIVWGTEDSDPQLYQDFGDKGGLIPLGHVEELAKSTNPNIAQAAIKRRTKWRESARAEAMKPLDEQVNALEQEREAADAMKATADGQIEALNQQNAALYAQEQALKTAGQWEQGGFLGVGASLSPAAQAIESEKAKIGAAMEPLYKAGEDAKAPWSNKQGERGAKAAQLDALKSEQNLWKLTSKSRAYEDLAEERRAVLKRLGRPEEGDPILAKIGEVQADYGMQTAKATQQAGRAKADFMAFNVADELAQVRDNQGQTPIIPAQQAESFIASVQRNAGNLAKDVPLSLLRGAIGLTEGLVGLADIASLGVIGNALESIGYKPAEAKQIVASWQSDDLNSARAKVAEAKGFLPTISAMAQNPSTIVDTVAESAPSMLGGAAIGRTALRMAPAALTRVAGLLSRTGIPITAEMVAAGIGEGAITAGSQAEQTRQQTGTLTPGQAATAVTSGAATSIIGVAGGRVAQALGIGDIDTMLVAGKLKPKEAGMLKRVIGGAFSEGVLEELPQSAQEQVAQNLATGKPWNEGVAESAAAGMVAGGVMGGGGNVPTGRAPASDGPKPTDAPPAQGGPATDSSLPPSATPPASDAPTSPAVTTDDGIAVDDELAAELAAGRAPVDNGEIASAQFAFNAEVNAGRPNSDLAKAARGILDRSVYTGPKGDTVSPDQATPSPAASTVETAPDPTASGVNNPQAEQPLPSVAAQENITQEPASEAGSAPNIDSGATSEAQADETKAVQAPAPDDYRYTVQRQQEDVPGFVQVDDVTGGVNRESGNVEKFRARGIDLPDVPDWLPQGRYTLGEIQKAIADGPPAQSSTATAAAPAPRAAVGYDTPQASVPEPLPVESISPQSAASPAGEPAPQQVASGDEAAATGVQATPDQAVDYPITLNINKVVDGKAVPNVGVRLPDGGEQVFTGDDATRLMALRDAKRAQKVDAAPAASTAPAFDMTTKEGRMANLQAKAKAAREKKAAAKAESAQSERAPRETVEPSKDALVGKNRAGESLYDRADGSRYRMRFDSPKTKPNGYPDFGGDLVPTVAESAPVAETPKTAQPESAPFTLPRDLAQAKPRYAYQDKQFTVAFDSDLDKALYILAQDKGSKRNADYLKVVKDATGMDDADVSAAAGIVRAEIKAQAKEGADGDTLRIPALHSVEDFKRQVRAPQSERESLADNQGSRMFPESNRLSSIKKDSPTWTRIISENPQLKSGPDEVTVYRAAISSELRPDDFVAVNQSVARSHIQNLKDRGESNAKITAHKVKVADLLMGNDATEFVWSPQGRESVSSTTQGITPEAATSALSDWRKANPTAPENIRVVNDPTMTRNGRGVRGLYQGGRLTLNAAFLRNADEVKAVLNHEWAHDTLATPRGKLALAAFAGREIPSAEMDALANKYTKRDGENALDYRLRVVEEWVAANAESQPTVWRKIVDAVRGFLNRAGLVTLTNEEAARAMLRTLRKGDGDSLQLPVSSQSPANASLSDTPRVYREASAYDAMPFIDRNSTADLSMKDVFVATSPELALGQGGNKGVRLEFDKSKLSLRANASKPGTAIAAEMGNAVEMVGRNTQEEYQNALTAFEFSPREMKDGMGRRLVMVAKGLEKQGWARTESGGVVRMVKPAAMQGQAQFSLTDKPKGKSLYRASKDGIAKSGAHFTESRSDAEAYTDNPGFGGPNVFRYDVKMENPLDLNQRSAGDLKGLAEAVGDIRGLDAEGKYDLSQEWKASGYGTVFSVLENARRVESELSEAHDWIKFIDDFPEGSMTWKYLGGDKISPLDDSRESLTPNQIKQTETPEFKKWFGESKVVDEQGKPLVVYHGTPDARFTEFRDGAHFTDNPEYASAYTHPSASSINTREKRAEAAAVIPAFLSIKRPFDTRIPGVRRVFDREFLNKYGNGTPLSERGLPDWTDSRDLMDWIEETGQSFDGLILDEGGTPAGGWRGVAYVPLKSNQVKSATGNRGTFDPARPDIRESLGEPLNPPKNAPVPGEEGKRFRSFTDTLIERGLGEVREKYRVQPQSVPRDIAKVFVDAVGQSLAAETVFDRSAPLSDDVKVAIGLHVVESLAAKRFDAALTDEQRNAATVQYERYAKRVSERLTELGRAIQIVDTVGKYTPEGALQAATGQAQDRLERILGADGRETIKQIMDAINKVNATAIPDVIEQAAPELKKVKVTKKMIEKTQPQPTDGTPAKVPTGKELDKAIKDAFEQTGKKIKDIIRTHHTEVDALGQSLADKLAEQAGLGKADAERLAGDIKKRLTETTDKAKKAVLEKIGKDKKGVSRRILTIADKIIEMSNAGALEQSEMNGKVAKELKLPHVTPEMAQKLRNLAEKAQKLPEGFQRDRVITDILSEIQKVKGAGVVDVWTAVYYAHILSGYTTQLVNIVSTAANVSADLSIEALRSPRNAGEALTGLLSGARRGLTVARSIIDTGYAHRSFDEKIPEVSPLLETISKEKMDSVGGKALKGYASVLRYVTRGMRAADAVFFHGASEAFQRVAAAKIAGAEPGLSREQRNQKIQQLLNVAPSAYDAAKAQAKAEGLDGIDYELRIGELIEHGRAEAIIDAGTRFGRAATFNQKPRGYLGVVARNVGDAANKFPPLKLFVPFTNIVANVTNVSLDYTPGPLIVKALGLNQERNMTDDERSKAGIPAVKDERTVKLAKAVAGTSAMVALFALGMGGGAGEGEEPPLSANGPADYAARNQKRESGWRPHTIRLFGRYWSYLETPLAIPMAIVGNYIDSIRYGKLDQKTAGERLIKALTGTGETLTNMSFLSGVADLMDTVRGKKDPSTFFAGVVASAVIPNLVRQIDRTFNPEIRDNDRTVIGKIQSAVPVARQSQPTRPNVYGEPVATQPINRFGQQATGDELAKVIEQKRAWVPEVRKGTKIDGRLMTDEERRIVTEKSGPIIKNRLRMALPALRSMTPERANALVDRIAREEHDRAKRTIPRQVRQIGTR